MFKKGLINFLTDFFRSTQFYLKSSAGASGALLLYILDIFRSKCGLACQTDEECWPPPLDVDGAEKSSVSTETVGGRPFLLLTGVELSTPIALGFGRFPRCDIFTKWFTLSQLKILVSFAIILNVHLLGSAIKTGKYFSITKIT